jgi:protein-tyrosine-phosphatase
MRKQNQNSSPIPWIIACLLSTTLLNYAQTANSSPAAKPETVVFVCEHGSAKSVIAAAHFNRLAAEKGLPYRAIARGTNPDEKVPAIVSDGLAGDGLTVSGGQPTRVSVEDVQKAVRTVTLATELTHSIPVAPAKLTKWNDVPAVSENYAAAREAIVRHVTELLGQLAAQSR